MSKTISLTALVWMIFSLLGYAVPPKKKALSDYKHILDKNPFRPLEQKVIPTKQPVKKKEDWIIKSLSHMNDGWLVVLAKKTSKNENVILRSYRESEGYPQIVEVNYDENNYTKSQVKINVSESSQQTASFDVEFLKAQLKKMQQQESSKAKQMKVQKGADKNKPRR